MIKQKIFELTGDNWKPLRRCLILPLVPPEQITNAFAIITTNVNSIEHDEPYRNETLLFIRYYKRTWIGDGPREPLFPKNMWSQYNVFQDRTNNRHEAFHHNFSDSVPPHANI